MEKMSIGKIRARIKKVADYFQSDFNYLRFRDDLKTRKKLLGKQRSIGYSQCRLLAVYDLLELPYTSDVANFLMNAEVERRQRGLEKIDFVIVGNDSLPANSDYEKRITKENYRHIVENLLIEYARLFPSIGSTIFFDNRNQIIDFYHAFSDKYCVFPEDYNPLAPFERLAGYERGQTHHAINFSHFSSKDPSYNCLTPPKEQVILVRRWLLKFAYPKIPITITLRETTIENARGNNMPQWQKLVDAFANDERYIFIVMRDYYSLYECDVLTGPNVIYCNEAVISLGFRAALHQEVSLNLFVTNGVNVVSTYSQKTRYLMFKVHTPGVPSATYKILKDVSGLSQGDSWHGHTKYQKYVWQDDDFDVMYQETLAMLDLLQQDSVLQPACYSGTEIQPEQTADVLEKDQTDKRQTLLSKRQPISDFILGYHLKTLIRLASYYCWHLPGFSKIKALTDTQLKKTDRVLIYGAGSVSTEILPRLDATIIGFVDRDASKTAPVFHNYPVYPLEKLESLGFDYLVITPLRREMDVLKMLEDRYLIGKERMLLVDKSILR